jgi:hypothetical protein
MPQHNSGTARRISDSIVDRLVSAGPPVRLRTETRAGYPVNESHDDRTLLPIRVRMFLALRNPACPPAAPQLLFPSTTACFQHKPFPATRPDRAHTSWLLSTAS